MAAYSLGPDLGTVIVTQDNAPRLETMFVVSELLVAGLSSASPIPGGGAHAEILGIVVAVKVYEFPDAAACAAAWDQFALLFKIFGSAVASVS